MVSSLEVLREISRQRVPIARHEDSSLLLGPKEKSRIRCADRQIEWIADAHGINRVLAKGIMPLDGLPQSPTAQVFVQYIAKRHRSRCLDGTIEELQPP